MNVALAHNFLLLFTFSALAVKHFADFLLYKALFNFQTLFKVLSR